MSHMQIDGQSSIPFSSAGQKRPRSPTPSSPQEKPSKRAALASGFAERKPPPLLGDAIQRQQVSPNENVHLQPCSLFQERRTPADDWVTKTSGLKLDSPSFHIGHLGSMSSTEARNRGCIGSAEVDCVEDEPMNTDMDDATPLRGSWLFPSTAGHDTARAAGHNTYILETFSSPMHSMTRQLTPINATTISPARSDIRIQVSEATPPHSESRRSSLSYPSPVSPSAHSSIWRHPSTSHRKPRITMGPRPDCEKCRSGIKGHWMHID